MLRSHLCLKAQIGLCCVQLHVNMNRSVSSDTRSYDVPVGVKRPGRCSDTVSVVLFPFTGRDDGRWSWTCREVRWILIWLLWQETEIRSRTIMWKWIRSDLLCSQCRDENRTWDERKWAAATDSCDSSADSSSSVSDCCWWGESERELCERSTSVNNEDKLPPLELTLLSLSRTSGRSRSEVRWVSVWEREMCERASERWWHHTPHPPPSWTGLWTGLWLPPF